MAEFTVIIPFYQREKGILRRALDSVFAQSFQRFDVIVVDDQSPVSADAELASLDSNQRSRITVMKHEANCGPGGARNTGLRNVSPSTRFVAFLDSDDSWLPNHLENAYYSMTRFEGDCYWCSIQSSDEFYYHVCISKLECSESVIRLAEKPPVIEVPELASAMLKDWSFLHLSGMVVGRAIFEKIRFDASLRLAAEDVLFFCDCILAARRTLLCAEPGIARGLGLNIFHSIDNRSRQFLRQQFNTWAALDALEACFARRPHDLKSITSYKDTARRQALWAQVGLLRRFKMPNLGLLARWAWRDPELLRTAKELGISKFGAK
ncbi:glycosyltransferase family 2 protein [Mesorhizobium sp. USDA-HM6]|nr:glycosyltransferase family 2 protein [Mesorhizobium sp. USDA-HM6]